MVYVLEVGMMAKETPEASRPPTKYQCLGMILMSERAEPPIRPTKSSMETIDTDGVGGVGDEDDEIDGIFEQAEIEEFVLLILLVVLVSLQLSHRRLPGERAGDGVQCQRGRTFCVQNRQRATVIRCTDVIERRRAGRVQR
ncbi:hypothetical protein ALC60_01662 [Trachymyrmex zeteki]|uniref:Uncharacterized protein n=1 Tax=Mycetomoellerius zeteki TaxID=64791 RepID=A0A151XG33_9HYME|nr:hypothetical protein ALC60_01662 [Trachymyrmex zeteki]